MSALSVHSPFLCDRNFLSHKKRSAEEAHLAERCFIAAQYRSGAKNLACEILCYLKGEINERRKEICAVYTGRQSYS